MSRRWMPSCLVSAGIIVAALAVFSPSVEAVQEGEKLLVSFETFDDAKLVGNFYKGDKGAESPVAILVHKFGSDRTKGGWDALAKELQKLHFAVLTFDLRGHGASTVVKDKFWNRNENKFGLRGGTNTKTKSTIAVTDFKNNYWPMLYNDLVAARRYVDVEQCAFVKIS